MSENVVFAVSMPFVVSLINLFYVFSKSSGTVNLNVLVFANAFLALLAIAGSIYISKKHSQIAMCGGILGLVYVAQAYNMSRYNTNSSGISTYSESARNTQVALSGLTILLAGLVLFLAYKKKL